MGEHQTIEVYEYAEYLSSYSYEDFLADTARLHPWLAAMIAPENRDVLDAYFRDMNQMSWEFEGMGDGGRGLAYNVAQRVVSNRSQGMQSLLHLFSEDGQTMPGPETVVLDALAGDGTISRFVQTLPTGPTIVCADLSALMVKACLDQGLPALRQTASQSLIQSQALDGVLIAYGSHHLPHPDRRAAAIEAKRTLKHGGRFVLHDFETGGPFDAWFGKVVHPFSRTGHPHPHFSRAEMQDLLTEAEFRDIRVFEMQDPFLIPGPTPEDARLGMLRHLHNMYDLSKLPLDTDADYDALEDLVTDTAGQIEFFAGPDGVTARLMRAALVAVGTA